MKVIFIGDPHFHTDNVQEINIFIPRLEELIQKTKPDLICVGGDLLHTHERLHSTPLNKINELLLMVKKYAFTYVLVGNHDYCNNQQFLTDNHWMNALKEWDNICIVDKVVYHLQDGYKFIFCPYTPPGRFVEALNIGAHENDSKWQDADCIFAHQEFSGWKIGVIVSFEGDKWPLDYPQVVSGHIHGKQKPQNNIFYTGSAMQHAFGESEQNIIAELFWENPGEVYTCIEHDLELPRKKMIAAEVEDIENVTVPEDDNKYKIVVSGNYESFKAMKKTKKYRELVKAGTKVVFKPQKIAKEKKDLEKVLNKITEEISDKDFKSILQALIVKEKDPYLFQAYEQIINDKRINIDDVMFLNVQEN